MNAERIENILEQCSVIGKNSKCSRKKFGAIITTVDGVPLSSGWNGTIRGSFNCGTDVKCIKDLFDVPSYQGYEMCPAIHAEENAVINAAREGVSVKGGIMFIAASNPAIMGMPCQHCKRTILNAGIEGVFYRDKSGETIMLTNRDIVREENRWMEEQEKIGESKHEDK
jgi:dCMP deaminase